MGKYDSSKYRVCPLMNFIGDNVERLSQLLRIVECDGIVSMPDIRISTILESAYKDEEQSKKEKVLSPLPQHLEVMKKLNLEGKLKGTPPVNSELEKGTHPDIFIETDKHVIVIEAKWTEKSTTRQTTYLKNRDQLIRHIEGAINYAPKKDIMAFYIVDEHVFVDNRPKNQTRLSFDGFCLTLKQETVQKPNLVQTIKSAYKGYTSWQKIESKFGKENLSFRNKLEIDKEVAGK